MKKLIIGLGNPEIKYKNTRHNIGKLLVDYLKKTEIKNQFILLKSSLFMNQSGQFVKNIIKKYQISLENLYIAHDDLDIPLGKFKINFASGPKLHNGIKSIEETLETNNFWRIRIGVDNRNKENWIDGESYVLENFLPKEGEVLKTQVFPKIIQQLKLNK